jgi:hypothetical protein
VPHSNCRKCTPATANGHRRAGSYPTPPHPFQPCMRDCIPSITILQRPVQPASSWHTLVPMSRLHSFHPRRSSLVIASSLIIVVVGHCRPRRSLSYRSRDPCRPILVSPCLCPRRVFHTGIEFVLSKRVVAFSALGWFRRCGAAHVV